MSESETVVDGSVVGLVVDVDVEDGMVAFRTTGNFGLKLWGTSHKPISASQVELKNVVQSSSN